MDICWTWRYVHQRMFMYFKAKCPVGHEHSKVYIYYVPHIDSGYLLYNMSDNC